MRTMAVHHDAFSSLLERLGANQAGLSVVNLMDNSDEKARQLGLALQSNQHVELVRMNLERLTEHGSYDALLYSFETLPQLWKVELHGTTLNPSVVSRFLNSLALSATVERIELFRLGIRTDALNTILQFCAAKKRVSFISCKILPPDRSASPVMGDRCVEGCRVKEPYTLIFSRCVVSNPAAKMALMDVLCQEDPSLKTLRFLSTRFGDSNHQIEDSEVDEFFATVLLGCRVSELFLRSNSHHYTLPRTFQALQFCTITNLGVDVANDANFRCLVKALKSCPKIRRVGLGFPLNHSISLPRQTLVDGFSVNSSIQQVDFLDDSFLCDHYKSMIRTIIERNIAVPRLLATNPRDIHAFRLRPSVYKVISHTVQGPDQIYRDLMDLDTNLLQKL